MSRKIFIIDTSVLLYDKTSIHSFPGNDIVLPMVVLEELDRFKDKPGLIGESARFVNRFLDDLRGLPIIAEWKTHPSHDIRYAFDVSAKSFTGIGESLDSSRNDNKIIVCALQMMEKYPDCKVVLVTKDINLRVKCDALGVIAEDYYKDHIDENDLGDYLGYTEIEFTDAAVDDFYSSKKLDAKDLALDPHTFVIGKSANKSFLARNQNGLLVPLYQEMCATYQIEPRNSEQRFAIEALLNPDIKLITLTGLAGSGKTFLSLMAALNSIRTPDIKLPEEFNNNKKRMVITRTLQPVGRDLGYLPGTMEDKMAPWLAPIMDNVRHAFNDLSYFQHMVSKGEIEIAPIPYIRGRTFTDAFIIVDEAQNATIHELKTIITRIGQGSKIVLLGDVGQIDTPYIDRRSNGLSIVIERFKKSKLAAHVHLTKGQRSDLATEAGIIL